MTDGIGTSPSRERAQPAKDEKKGTERDKSKSPDRPDGIGTSP